MIVYTLVKADFGHRENIGTFTTLEKAQAFQAAEEIREFDSGSLAGVSYFIQEMLVQ